MELIKETDVAGSRKLYVYSEQTGYSAFFTTVEDNISLTVGKLKEYVAKNGEPATRIDSPTYHMDTESAVNKMCKVAAKKFFIEGSPNSYNDEWLKEYEALTSK